MRNVVRSFCLLMGGLFVAASCAGANAAEKTFGPFTVDGGTPDIIRMDGRVDAGSALNFRRALAAAPAARLVVLNSPGGLVPMGLLIADDIHQRGLSTYIPAGSECFSACSYIFLAGHERQVEGALGVHQISNDSSDLVSAQFAISDILEVLNRFDTPAEVMQIMFKTPPDDMYVFTPEEVAQYSLNRSAGEGPGPADNDVGITRLSPASTPPASRSPEPQTAAVEALPAPSTPAKPNLSALEQFASRPNRMAIYTGLDLFGGDIDSARVADATACAERCLHMEGECKAFTFNISPRLTRGPNCFLKSNPGRADGNSVAFSGRLLTAVDSNPPRMTLGTIDPETALFEDVDLPGGDLSRHPARSARTAQSCRLACIDETRCVAFTYVQSRKECWLKGRIGTPAFKRGMLSGLKTHQSFEPSTILSLD